MKYGAPSFLIQAALLAAIGIWGTGCGTQPVPGRSQGQEVPGEEALPDEVAPVNPVREPGLENPTCNTNGNTDGELEETAASDESAAPEPALDEPVVEPEPIEEPLPEDEQLPDEVPTAEEDPVDPPPVVEDELPVTLEAEAARIQSAVMAIRFLGVSPDGMQAGFELTANGVVWDAFLGEAVSYPGTGTVTVTRYAAGTGIGTDSPIALVPDFLDPGDNTGPDPEVAEVWVDVGAADEIEISWSANAIPAVLDEGQVWEGAVIEKTGSARFPLP